MRLRLFDNTSEVLETPTAATVLERATACSLVHFACHDALDIEQPSKSALLDGTGSVEKLTIRDLQSLNHQLAQVAYLSACSTAELGAQSLIDESINLATTFSLLAFDMLLENCREPLIVQLRLLQLSFMSTC